MPGLQLMDTTIRDGQQSLWATRMRLGDMLPILPKMDKVGYWAIEAWGGATFDTCLRFLDENPWERLRSIKAHTPNTDLAMLSRGQNLVGYKHYSKDVVDHFISAAHRNGNVKTARTHRKHTHTAASGGVTVRAYQCFSGL